MKFEQFNFCFLGLSSLITRNLLACGDMSLRGGEYCYSLDSTYCTVIPERRLIRHVTDRLSGVLHLLMID